MVCGVINDGEGDASYVLEWGVTTTPLNPKPFLPAALVTFDSTFFHYITVFEMFKIKPCTIYLWKHVRG